MTDIETALDRQAEYSFIDQRDTTMTDWLKENFTGGTLRVVCREKKKG